MLAEPFDLFITILQQANGYGLLEATDFTAVMFVNCTQQQGIKM